MDEILQKLLDADILSEDTKKELEEAVQAKLQEAEELAKAEASAQVRAELTEQWVEERDALIEALDSKVTGFLEKEAEELKEDIERFRDLEAEHAEKLVEAKSEMSTELKGDLAELVEKLDAFLEIRLTAEVEELREDIEDVRKNEAGRKMFEAFKAEYQDLIVEEESDEVSLRETQEQLDIAMNSLQKAETKLADKERSEKLSAVLSPLGGQAREVMEPILRNVSTEKLEEGYKTFIGRVLKESEETSEKEEAPVLAEGDTEVKTEKKVEVELKTGNDKALEEDHKEEDSSDDSKVLSEAAQLRIQRLKTLSGIV